MDKTLVGILQQHVEYYRKLEINTREQQLRREASAVSDYRGRVLLELLQNAIDRAESRIVIRLEGDRLLVGNDNADKHLTIEELPEDAKDGRLQRSDFHALCSSDTSNKLAYECIGNKGIGFKSVFRHTRSVDVWSRRDGTGPWWGFRLRHPFTDNHAKAIADVAPPSPLFGGWRELWSGIARRLDGLAAPSFYFPEPLDPRHAPALHPEMVTVVVLHCADRGEIARQLEQLQTTRLHFISVRYPDKTGIVIDLDGSPGSISFHQGWSAAPPMPLELLELIPRADDEGLDFTEAHPPKLQLAFPPEGVDVPNWKPHFYCFFPTKLASGFHTDIHADFVLDQNRNWLEFRPGSYNLALLKLVPQLLDDTFVARLHCRVDAWRFLTPNSRDCEELVKAMRTHLFGDHFDQTERWRALCELAFDYWESRGGAPPIFYKDFWKMVEAWGTHRGKRTNWDKFREQILSPLDAGARKRQALPIVPLCGAPAAKGDDVWSHPDPIASVARPRGERRRVLLKGTRTDRNQVDIPTPEVLRARVAVTWSFPLANSKWWAGIEPFDWNALVLASRGWITGPLPTGGARWSPDDPSYVQTLLKRLNSISEAERKKLLEFWYAMALETPVAREPPLARLLARAGDRIRGDKLDRSKPPRLRAEAAIPLPVLGNGWLPACRVSRSKDKSMIDAAAGYEGWGVVDRTALAKLGVEPECHDSLLDTLGCFAGIPLLSSGDHRGLHLPFEPSRLDPQRWQAVLAVWPEAFERDKGELEGPRFAESTRHGRWLPLGKATWSPDELWRVKSADHTEYALLPVLREPERVQTSLWRALGVDRLPPREGTTTTNSTKALSALRRLREHPDSLNRSSELRDVYARLVRALDDDVQEVPVLAATSTGRPEWVEAKDAWVVHRDHAGKQRYFPELLAVCAEGSLQLAQRLGTRYFQPTVTVQNDPESSAPVDDPALRERLAELLPVLILLARHLRVGASLTTDEVVARWELGRIQRGENVFIRIEQDGLKTVERGRRLNGQPLLNDVFLKDDHTAWHDIPDLDKAASEWLHRFAPWFAQAVFNRSQLERPFLSLLEHIGDDQQQRLTLEDPDSRARTHLERQGVDLLKLNLLRRDVIRKLMSDDERQALWHARACCLEDFGSVRADAALLVPVLGPEIFEDIHEHARGRTEEEVERALGALDRLTAQFRCLRAHQTRWTKRKPQLKEGILVRHLLQLGLKVNDEFVEKLHQKWEGLAPTDEELCRLGFDPDEYARAKYPGREPTDDDEFRRACEVLARRPYAALDPTARTEWIPPKPRKAGTGPAKTTGNRDHKNTQRRIRGENAEQARAAEAARRLWRCSPSVQRKLDAERARIRGELTQPKDLLLPIGWHEVDEAQLAKDLRLAGEVDCGYDVLDYDLDNDQILRIEVKSIQTKNDTAKPPPLHISANEVRRALETRDEPDVTYRLEVYLGYHRRIDATPALNQALNHAAKWLATPQRLEPEGYLLDIRLSGRERAGTK